MGCAKRPGGGTLTPGSIATSEVHDSMSTSPGERNYKGPEIAAILRRAQRAEQSGTTTGQASSPGPGLTHAELLETAREVGMDERQVALAVVEYEEELQLSRAAGELRQISYRRFTGHLIVGALGNALLAATGVWAGSPLWLVILMVTWGALVMMHLRGVVFPDPDSLRERSRNRLAQQRLKGSTRALGQALSHGAAKLLSATAKKIDKQVNRL